MSRAIPLTNGMFAVVDDEDWEFLSAYTWYAQRAPQIADRWYAIRCEKIGGKTRSTYMHRAIMQPERGVHVDHANNDGLDNRRSNLRLCTRAQNNANRRAATPVTGFRGVHAAPGGGFRAHIQADRITIRTTAFQTAVLAARAYDALAREFQGEFAVLNFPRQGERAA